MNLYKPVELLHFCTSMVGKCVGSEGLYGSIGVVYLEIKLTLELRWIDRSFGNRPDFRIRCRNLKLHGSD